MEYYPPGGAPNGATDTNAVHKDGSDTMTGPLNLGSGSKIICAASGTLGSTNYEIVRTGGNTFFINAPNTGDIELGNAGSGKLNIGSAGVRLLGTGGAGHLVFQTSSGGALSTRALTPSDMPAGASQGGTSHAADATWRNQYSLAAGTHTGFVWVTDDFGAATLYTLNGTTITWFYNYGSNSWGSADSTHRHLRVSGGYIQVYNGTGLATANVSTFFMGTVR